MLQPYPSSYQVLQNQFRNWKTMPEYFPRDLYLQILKWLPLNSILQCRTVSKSWNSLITSSDFISAHHNLTKSTIDNGNQTLLIRYFDRTSKLEQYIIGKDDETFGSNFSNIEFQYASTSAYFRVVGYSNGVFCLSDDDLFDSMSLVILWNPSIRKSIRVTIPKFDQTFTQRTVLGFGVCPKTHDPKIVRFVYMINFSTPHKIEDSPLIDVFSLTLGAWRKPLEGNCKTLHKLIRITWIQVCFNGVIHWAACDWQLEARLRCLIISFDLVREVFDEMPLPDVLASRDISYLSISTRKGYLAMVEYDMERGKESCGVWAMKEYGVAGSWEKLYVVHLPGMLRKSVGFMGNGDMVVALKNHELVIVECTGNIRSLDIYANIRSFFLGSYMESLILISQVDQQVYLVKGDDDEPCAR